MPDEFAYLYGRSLVAFARETAGDTRWDRIFIAADRVTLDYSVDAIAVGFGAVLPPIPPTPPVIAAVFAAVAANRLGLMADGDDSLGHAVDLMVPPGLLRGDYRVHAVTDAEAYLRAVEDRREVGPRYRRPRFAPPGSGGRLAPPGSWPRLLLAILTGGWLHASARHGKGNTAYDDTVAVARARAYLAKMAKPAKDGAAAAAIDQMIAEGHPVDGLSREAWIKRVRQQL